VAKVDCVGWPGWHCWFWSQDHREAHFHVKCSGKWEVRVFFGEDPPYFDVQWQLSRVPVKQMREFLQTVASHRAELFEEWTAKVNVVDP
jgi:hypothetical protein